MGKEMERKAEKAPYDGTELPKDLKELKGHFGGRLDRYSMELKNFAEERFHQFLIVTPGTHKRKGYCTFCRRELDLGNLPGLPDMPRRLKHNDTTICPRCGHELTVITYKRYEDQEVFFYWWEKSAINPMAIVCRGIHGLRRRERDSMEKARTLWETDSASVFIYGKGSVMAYSKPDKWMEKEMRYSLKYVLGKVHGRTGQYTGGLGWWTADRKKTCLWAADSFRRAREGTPFAWIEGFGKHIKECQAVGTPIWDLVDGELFSMAMFCKYRSWEWLMKMGLSDILEDYATRRDPSVWDVFNFRGKTVDRIFRGHLTKGDKKFLYYEKLDNTGPIRVWQACRKRWPSITLKEVALLDDFTGNEMKHRYLSDRLQDMMLVIRPDRLLRYAMKEEDRHEKIYLRDYLDYYEECRDLGKNLSDKDVIFPADFKKAHEHAAKELVALKNLEKQGKWDKRRPACEERYRFGDKSGRYLVVPQKLQDLVTEGEHMHNCVGTYTDRLADGCSDILFVRKAENPAESYITVEVDPKDGHIRQAREKYNRDIEDSAAKEFIKTLEKHAQREAARAKVIEIRNPEQRGEQCEERRMAQ